MSGASHVSYRWSRYLRWKVRGRKIAVFHELHPHPLVLEIEAWERSIRDPDAIDRPLRDHLMKEGILVTAGHEEDDAAYERADSELQQRLDRASILYLVLVEGCNFACPYCPIALEARQHGDSHMTFDIARASIDLWIRHLRDFPIAEQNGAIILYGGEPLLNRAVIRPILDYLTSFGREGRFASDRISVMISTNASLIDEELIQLFKRHNVSVAVGCDGPEQMHNSTRPSIFGEGTFQTVERMIRLLVNSGIRTFVSTAVTPYNIEWVQEATSFFQSYGIEKFGFNFLRGRLLLSLVSSDRLHSYYDKATAGVLANARRHKQHDFEYQMERKYAAYYGQKFFPTDCNAYGNQLVVHADGQIGNCPFIKGAMGNILSVPPDFRIHRMPLPRAWRKRLPLYNDNCHACEAKSICGGGCAWNVAEVKGDAYAVDEAMCLLTKRAFEALVWEDLPQGGVSHASS